MGAYMYPINIDRNTKTVSYEKEYDLSDIELSLKQLKKYVNDEETFIIDSDNFKIKVYGKRSETQKETKERIKKEEKYMENYKKFHENKNKL